MPVRKIIIVKSIADYRGRKEEFSNQYLVDTAASDVTALLDLAYTMWTNVERPLHDAQVKVERVYAYLDPAGTSSGSRPLAANNETGTGGSTTNWGSSSNGWEPNQALVAAAPAGLTSKGRPRYVTKYYHLMYGPRGMNLDATQRTYANGKLVVLTNGTLPGGAVLCRPDGTHTGTMTVKSWVGFHQLKRRGKRPTSP